MVSTSVAVPLLPLKAPIVTLKEPATVGVPEITPVDVLTDKPEGRPEAE